MIEDERTRKIIQTIIKHCNIIEDTIKYFGEEKFDESLIFQNAVLTPVTQIGELVKRISEEFRGKHSEIPWRNIAGMRDIVVHGYETIDKKILWNVAKTEIPKLKMFCLEILK